MRSPRADANIQVHPGDLPRCPVCAACRRAGARPGEAPFFLDLLARPRVRGQPSTSPVHHLQPALGGKRRARRIIATHQTFQRHAPRPHAPAQVPDADLDWHISEAVKVARPRRIGHGNDLPFERDALATLQEMKVGSGSTGRCVGRRAERITWEWSRVR